MRKLFPLLLVVALIVPPSFPGLVLSRGAEALGSAGESPSAPRLLGSPAPLHPGPSAPPLPTGLYRSRVALRQPADRARLERLGVVVLAADEGRKTEDEGLPSFVPDRSSVIVLADEEQLEALARLRFQPQGTDELGALVAAHAQAKPWLATSLRPLLEQAAAARSRLEAEAVAAAEAYADVQALLRALTPEQMAGVTALSSVDDDADGLTNTEEAWWCTDPLNPNSDGDAQGYTDGQEVAALLDFTLPRNVRWGYGPPFGPPNAWPDFNGADGNPATPACNDGDWDTIPDYAEAYIVGSRVPEESSDRDKFDDGQELFGVTYCPGAPTNCGYGSYPAIEYWNWIQARMPNWVLPPGDNLFVAAFPVPEVYVTPGSWHVERVTTVTTAQGEMTQTEHSYETSVMRGQSTSIADTVTWNNWEEVSQAVETPLGLQSQIDARASSASVSPDFDLKKFGWGTLKIAGGVLSAAAGCLTPAGALSLGLTCYLGAAGAAVGIAEGVADWADAFKPDDAQQQQETNKYNITNVNNVSASASANASVVLNQNFDFQGVVNSLDGVQYAINQQGELLARGLYDISYAISQPRFTETRTSGRSWGGAQTTTHEVYEEHTLAEGEAFTTGENWSTAWAVDSSHAADLTFEFTVKNSGTEYARELKGMIVNVYIGDDTSPAISYPAWEKFPDGKIENLFPGNTHTFTSNPIALTLDKMRRIDLGERLTVVVEDYSFGADELFYQNAVQGGVTVFIEDGVEDGDESVDMYVIPTWGVESVLDVLTRYFPHGEDAEGNLNSLWTPEFDGANPPTWNEHYLSDIAWWNVYLTQADAGNTPLKDLPAVAGSAILFRFNRDSDRDGYSDRAEFRYYCALPADHPDAPHCADGHLRPDVHPQPEVLAGYVAERSGNVVTVKLVVENSGTFDAYGIDAVMYSPDDTTTIGNNTVGGNGRARPSAHVAVGSLIKPPDLSNWGSSTAKPYSGGDYTGSADRTYTFSAATPGVVGQGGTAMTWSDGAGGSGPLDLGSSYHAPLPLDVADGLQVGFNTGTILAGASFTVQALTPRDTFTYTIHSEPYRPPVIVVSYSDPQGSHRFVTPVELPGLDASLAPHTGEMLKGLRLEIVTTGALSTTNTTNLVVNNPHPETVQDGHLYLNFVSDGELVLEKSYTLDIPAGPTVFPTEWYTTEFSADYNPDGDNILIAFWTDSENNIIDSAARPLDTFAEDPKPAFAMREADEVWDFGTAAQGTLLRRTIAVGSVGFMDLLAHVGSVPGLSISGQGSRRLPPGDVALYDLTLKTADLPEGPFETTLTIRTSDPERPTRTITIRGNITPMPPDSPGGAILRPLDWDANIAGDHNQGEWVEFTHTLGPDPQTLHPVKVYSQDYSTLHGVGKYATPFGSGTASYDMFGDGRDGSLIVGSGAAHFVDNNRATVVGTAGAGQTSLSFAYPSGGQIDGYVNYWPKYQWFDTGIRLSAGDRLRIVKDEHGHPDLGDICYGGQDNLCFDANGSGELAPAGWTAPGIRKFSLVAMIGSGAPFFVGKSFDAVIGSSGVLYLGLNDCNGCFGDNVQRWWYTHQIQVFPASYANFLAGDLALVIQVTGNGAGQYELVRVASSGTGWITLAAPLQHTYSTGGASVAQIIRVPQYSNVTVQNGGEIAAHNWSGATGGVVAMLVRDQLSVEAGGRIMASNLGFAGGREAAWSQPNSGPAYQGASYTGAPQQTTTAANGGGGGGGQNNGGGGGGYGSFGQNSYDWQGLVASSGGAVYGSADLSAIFLGSGGGGAGHYYQDASQGGRGGGAMYIVARNMNVAGIINAGAQGGWQGPYGGYYPAPTPPAGSTRNGGGGSGGSIKLILGNGTLGTNLITALGGPGGKSTDNSGHGGDGGVGRIRVEYCDTVSGSTNPSASSQRISCYIIEQIESAPYDRARLNLPESFTGGRTYKIQYGRRMLFDSPGEQTPLIRLPRQIYASASLDGLVSDTGVSSGDLNLSLDIGNDGTVNWSHSATTDFPTTLVVTDVVDALNAYLVSRDDVVWGADVDVPVRVQIDRQAQVILTNLVLSLQFNQPTMLRAASVDTGADRPLDWTTVIPGDHSQGEAYDFTHTLGPEPISIHPCKVYDQSGSTLKGVGKYCSDFGTGTLPYQVFGTGRDDDLTVGSGQTMYVDDVRTALSGSASAGQRTVSVASTNGFDVGDEVLIIQMQGTGAGNYEFGTVESVGSGSLTLVQDLANDYTVGSNSKAQVLKVPHYRDVTVQGGGTLTAHAWDGTTGGILALRVSAALDVQSAGVIHTNGKGFRGGIMPDSGWTSHGNSGESQLGPSVIGSYNANGGGGGGGCDYQNSGGSGSSYGSEGTNGGGNQCANDHKMGYVYGDTSLTSLFLGSGGGSAGGCCADGGSGGGLIAVFARTMSILGRIESRGANGQDGVNDGPAGGAGSGGSIKLTGQAVSLGSNLVTAIGGTGGWSNTLYGGTARAVGGNGGSGRIRIEYQNITPGWSTNPSASTQQRQFYAIEQLEQSPYTTTRFYLPESFIGGRTYIVQFGRRFVFDGVGEQTNTLRLNRQMYGTASLDALVSNTGVSSGSLNLCLDVGDDGTCDFTHNASTDFPTTLNVTGLETALNDYLLGRTDVAWGDPVDVPVRVQIDRQADVMLTNLALTPVGAKTRFLRLPARSYSDVTISLQFSSPGVPSGPLAFTVDVGADGSTDWSYAGTPSFPAIVTSPNLAGAFNGYLSGLSDEVDVPIRIIPSPFLDTALHDFSATPADRPDLTVSLAGTARFTGLGSLSPMASASGEPTEGDIIALTATLHNTGAADSGPLTVSFFATAPGWGGQPQGLPLHIGSDFVPNVPASGNTDASIPWNTLGFTGDVPVRVVVDPFNRVTESNEENNEATTTLSVLSRADLHVPAIEPADPEPVAGQQVTVQGTLHNSGQTTASDAVVCLYDGHPDDVGSIEVGCQTVTLPGGAQTDVVFSWTPLAPGLHRLFLVSDRDDIVWEYDEGNNQTWMDLYVGFAGPILLDSGGGDAHDPAYDAAIGFGYLNGQANTFCGTAPEQSQRSDGSGQVQYRFDHLLPGHFYHLDITLYECDGLGRQEHILVDGNLISEPVDLGDGEVHKLSFLLDPAFYADNSIIVTIEEVIGYDALVAEINLHDVDYRYADAGGSKDPQYPGSQGYGWLDGVVQTPWGTLPYQSRRIDLGDADPSDDPDNELRYRFDNLSPGLRYQTHLVFYQGAGGLVQQSIAMDSIDTGTTVELSGAQRVDVTINVPPGTYAADGSIVLRITRTNALAGAFVNEVALEELTLEPDEVQQVTQVLGLHSGGPNWISFNVKPPIEPAAACTGVTPTSAFTTLAGDAILADQPAPVGTIVEAFTPGGVKVGCFKVHTAGSYGYMKVYGAEGATGGMQPGEPIFFKVNGISAPPDPSPVIWQNDQMTHFINLTAPDQIPVEYLLAPIDGQYSKLLCEDGTFLPPPADPRFNTCTTVSPGRGYLLYANTAADLPITGVQVPADTPLALREGWNWLGYLPTCALPVETALNSIAGSYDLLHNEIGTYSPPPANPAYNNFNTMAPDLGYMIHVIQDVTLTYPAGLCGLTSGVDLGPAAAEECPAIPTGYFTHYYGQVRLGDRPYAAGATILAFSPRGEVVGCGQVGEDGLYPYLRVYGADGDLPGMLIGEAVQFTVDGCLAPISPLPIWEADYDIHYLDLIYPASQYYLPLIQH